MRIVLCHNYYGSEAPSGENLVFDEEVRLLRRRGHEVFPFTRSSDRLRRWGTLGELAGGLSTLGNPFSWAALSTLVRRVRPDVVHVHNTFPLLSPLVFRAGGRAISRVLTLHNYRHFCPNAVPMRDGRVCTRCLERRSVGGAVAFGCYRGSRVKTLPLAANVALYRRTWRSRVDAFVALTTFQRDLLVRAGLPADRIFVRPNAYAGDPPVLPWEARTDSVVFAGRLSAEKGADYLLGEWATLGVGAPVLHVFGDGPQAAALRARHGDSPRVKLHGLRPPAEVLAAIATAKLVVVPSRCIEGFPLVIREAFAFGTPVAASAIGPLPGLVADARAGWTFAPDAPGSLSARIAAGAWRGDLGAACGRSARRAFEESYSEPASYERLMAVYAAARERRSRS